MIWFTGDEHFGHKNVIHHCKRPFKDINKMRDTIITNVNKVTKPGDTVWHLGDFIWYGPDRKNYYLDIMKRYREGVTHHLILGNHDSANPFMQVDVGFTTVHTAMPLEIDGIKFILAHDPSVYCYVDENSVLICGHIHTLFKTLPDSRTINVGVDMWDFCPVSIVQIMDEIKSWKKTAG